MANNGQTINDRILAARHSLAGQGLAKAVCKATTEELIGPKKKHLDYLLHCTEEPNVSIPSLANLLIERTQSTNWIVVFKGLVTIHHLMCYGNERFVQYLASSNTNFQLSSFLDKSGVQGGGTVRGYDMSPFIRKYASYLNEKAVSYRTVAFDFCKVKRGKDGGTLRSMTAEKLFKTIPALQSQIDALVDFEITTNDLNNGVINSAFMLLFRDLIRLFACYNDGIINLLEKYFDMHKKNAREALDIYKKFLLRMDKVAEFLKVAEIVGIDSGDIPDFAKAPSSLLEALEAHLANLEGRKPGSTATTPTAPSGGSIDEKLQQKILAEEEQAMAKYKEQHKATNPFAAPSDPQAASDNGTPNILDLFGCSAPPTVNNGNSDSSKTSDDLLQLSGGNPFAAVMNAAAASAPQPYSNNTNFAPGFASSNANGFHNRDLFSNSSYPPLVPGGNNAFASDSSFRNAFGPAIQSEQQRLASDVGASFFGDILQPQGTGMAAMSSDGNSNGSNAKVITGDLDASLANLTSNLNLGAGLTKKLTPIRN